MLAVVELLPPGYGESWPLRHSLSLRGAPGAVPHARHFAAGALFNWNFSGQMLCDAQVVVSELVTNAVQACQADRTTRLCRVQPITLKLRSNFADAVIEVVDPIAQPPQPYNGDAEHGRGLTLVTFFSKSWGFYRTEDGKSVWASFTRY